MDGPKPKLSFFLVVGKHQEGVPGSHHASPAGESSANTTRPLPGVKLSRRQLQNGFITAVSQAGVMRPTQVLYGGSEPLSFLRLRLCPSLLGLPSREASALALGWGVRKWTRLWTGEAAGGTSGPRRKRLCSPSLQGAEGAECRESLQDFTRRVEATRGGEGSPCARKQRGKGEGISQDRLLLHRS